LNDMLLGLDHLLHLVSADISVLMGNVFQNMSADLSPIFQCYFTAHILIYAGNLSFLLTWMV